MTQETYQQFPISVLDLAPILDSASAGALASNLMQLRGQPIEVSASANSRISTLCIQVLISAAATWKSDGWSFRVNMASTSYTRALELLGLGQSNLSAGFVG